MEVCWIVSVTLSVILTGNVAGLEVSNEYRIHHLLFKARHYNKLVRPEGDTPKGSLTLKLSINLAAIMDVSEKDQILTTSLWLRHRITNFLQEWTDPRLSWDPIDTGGMNYTVIPSDLLWIPDIILYNNADGEFVISPGKKATVYHTGRIVWNPPAIYKSYCPIDVEFFPFDQQECFMKFGSWTNDIHTIDLRHIWEMDRGVSLGPSTFIPYGIDICGYQRSGEWDLINVTATRANKVYPCCQDDPYPYIMFNITIRRKTLFYTVNLILPIVGISTLSVLVFYLPSNSCEKMTLSMSILVALSVFFLLLSDINPPTSLVTPLIVKFLLFTMFMVTLSIFLTVYILSIHCRSPSTHAMKPWVRKAFIEVLPKYIYLQKPKAENSIPGIGINDNDDMELQVLTDDSASRSGDTLDEDEKMTTGNLLSGLRKRSCVSRAGEDGCAVGHSLLKQSSSKIKYIANKMENEHEDQNIELEWSFVAMVIDRLLLYIMTTVALLGTCGIFMNAPTLYDPTGPLSTDIQNC